MINKKNIYYIIFFVALFLIVLFNIIAGYLDTNGFEIIYIKILRTIGNIFIVVIAILEFNKNKLTNKNKNIVGSIFILLISVINFIIIWFLYKY